MPGRAALKRLPWKTGLSPRYHERLVCHRPDEEVHHQPPAAAEAVRTLQQCLERDSAVLQSLSEQGRHWLRALLQTPCDWGQHVGGRPGMTRTRPHPNAQVIEVIHPGLAGVSKNDLKDKLAAMYKVRHSAAAALLVACE